MLKAKRQLKKLRKNTTPRREFKRELLSKLSNSYDEEYASTPACLHRFRFAAVGLTAVVLMFSMGTGVYAYESPKVVEGHPLNFIKVGLESVEEKFRRSPEARARFHARMMERRLNEGEYRLPHKPEQVGSFLKAAATQLELTIEDLDGVPNEKIIRAHIIEQLSVHNARYQELAARVVDSEGEIGALESIRQSIRDGGLSEYEQTRLFQIMSRAKESEGGR